MSEEGTAPAGPAAAGTERAWLRAAVQILAFALAAFHIWTAYFGPFYAISQRAFHVGVAMALTFLTVAPLKRGRGRALLAADVLAAAATLAVTAYVMLHQFRILRELGYADPTEADTLLGYLMVALIIEASRRVVGWEFAVLTVATLVYGYVGPWLPGMFEHAGFEIDDLVVTSFLNPMGIYGQMTAVSATTIAVYVVFGSLLLATGGASAFLSLALMLAGRVRGGAAQVAVIGSGIMGMVNGSAVANTATVGSMTIPLMKRQGYPAYLAGAVEAAASSGGQIMPPIMGAGAFVMAELVGIPYLQIAVMAIIPAVLYYAVISGTLYFEACKRGFQPLTADEIPRLRDSRRDLLVFLVPIGFLMALLIMAYTPRYAGFWAIASCVGVYAAARLGVDRDGTLGSRLREVGRKLWEGCVHGAQTAATIGIIVAASQIIVAVMGLTGVGLKVSEAIFSVSQGSVLLAFGLAAVVNIVLGLGLPTVPSYIITVAIVGPALSDMGVAPVVVHMFSFFYACMSGLTPPVAATSFVAAGIAQANVWSTSWSSCRLAFAGYVVPLIFALDPAVLGFGTAAQVASASVLGLVGCLLIAAAFTRYWIHRLDLWQSAAAGVGGLLLMVPGLWTQLAGAGLGALALLTSARRGARVAAAGQATLRSAP